VHDGCGKGASAASFKCFICHALLEDKEASTSNHNNEATSPLAVNNTTENLSGAGTSPAQASVQLGVQANPLKSKVTYASAARTSDGATNEPASVARMPNTNFATGTPDVAPKPVNVSHEKAASDSDFETALEAVHLFN
jgi:hypothetical protein